MACALCQTTIHSDIEYVDVILTHHFDSKTVNQKRTYLCPDCARSEYERLGLGS